MPARTESVYLILSNKEKCKNLLSKNSLTEEEMIDFYISLHIVMEVSLNALFRNLSLIQIQKSINKLEIAKNIDSINFIDKTILFIYNYHYSFNGKIHEADLHHRVIKYIKIFSEVRNKLLHGHSISTLYTFEGDQDNSETKKMLSEAKLIEQIKLFKRIFEGLRFYVDHLTSSLSDSGKDTYKKEYLNDGFLINHPIYNPNVQTPSS